MEWGGTWPVSLFLPHLDLLAPAGHFGDVAHDVFGCHRLPSSTLSTDDDTLVLTVDEHVPVHVVREGVDVWGILILGLARKGRPQPRAVGQWPWGLCLPPGPGLTAPW